MHEKWPQAEVSPTGLRYVVLEKGQGEPARTGDTAKVLYKGYLLDGTVFDETDDPQQPFSVEVGEGRVIRAWDEALKKMLPGERRILIVPSELGYGVRGRPPQIPPRATLVFEVELLSIERSPRDAGPGISPAKG